jgi:hypothetical protein
MPYKHVALPCDCHAGRVLCTLASIGSGQDVWPRQTQPIRAARMHLDLSVEQFTVDAGCEAAQSLQRFE